MSNTKDSSNVHYSVKNDKTLWLVLSVTLLLRWVHLLIISGSDLVHVPIIDSAFYHKWAMSIAAGSIIGENIFFMSPLYPYLMGLVYAITGVSAHNVMILQSLLSAGTVFFLYLLTMCITGKRAAKWAGLSAAVYAPFIFYDGTLLTSSVILFLSSIILYYSYKAVFEDDGIALWITGLIIGLSALARPLVLIFLPFLFFAFLRKDKATWLKRSVLVLLAVFIMLLPVSIRNLIVGKEFTLTTSSAGMNFYVGNNPNATGLYWEAPFLTSAEPWYEDEDYRMVASQEVERELTTREAGRYWMRRSVDWIINNPGDYLKLIGKKIYLFWNSAEFANNVSIYMGKEVSPLVGWNPFGFWIVAPFGIGGLILLWRRKGWSKAGILWLWIFAYFAGGLLFFISSEYRLPILISLHIGFGYFITTFIDRFKERKPEPILNALVAGLLLMPFINFRTNFVSSGTNARMDHFNIAETLVKSYRYPEAIKHYERSLEIDPYFAEGMLRLADAYYRTGQRDKMMEIGRRAGLEKPEDIIDIVKGGAMKEAFALMNEGELEKAMKEFLAAGMDTASAVAETTRVSRLIEAQHAFKIGDQDRSLELFKLVRENDDQIDPIINYNIAFILWQRGQIDSAEVYAAEVMQVDSLNVPAGLLLARIYNATNRREEAEALTQRIQPDEENRLRILEQVRLEIDTLLAQNKWEEALRAYARYGKLGYETEPEDKYRLARAQIEVGNFTLALRLLDEASESLPLDPELIYHQGRALANLGQFGQAVEHLRKALTVDPDFVEPHIALARIYMLLGKKDMAWMEIESIQHLEILKPEVEREFNNVLDSLKQM